MDNGGDFFGTTFDGGPDGCGTIYRIRPGVQAKALYSFACGKDGAYPYAGLLRDDSGNLYGTTESGGDSGWGTVFVFGK
jgi:uncharacterized repeat protein (TIGR03803 family)